MNEVEMEYFVSLQEEVKSLTLRVEGTDLENESI